MLYESGPAFEYEAAKAGHYPEARNKKGIEPEGVEVGAYGDDKLLFVAAERASLVGVYKDTGAEPEFMQVLPSGIGPEGIVAIPSRNLFVTANEVDLGEDGLARSHVMIYELAEGTPAYPMIAVRPAGRRHAARLGRAVGPRRRPDGRRQALCGVGFGLPLGAGDLHHRRHHDAGDDHGEDDRHARRRCRPKSSTSKASRPTARAASGWPRKAHRQADAARHPACRRQGQDRPRRSASRTS